MWPIYIIYIPVVWILWGSNQLPQYKYYSKSNLGGGYNWSGPWVNVLYELVAVVSYIDPSNIYVAWGPSLMSHQNFTIILLACIGTGLTSWVIANVGILAFIVIGAIPIDFWTINVFFRFLYGDDYGGDCKPERNANGYSYLVCKTTAATTTDSSTTTPAKTASSTTTKTDTSTSTTPETTDSSTTTSDSTTTTKS